MGIELVLGKIFDEIGFNQVQDELFRDLVLYRLVFPKSKLKNGESAVIKKGNRRLIITYSNDRAKKDKYNREKGLRKLEKRIRKWKLTKSSKNKRGYNKYLRLEGEINVIIDREKFEQDAKWDGLKGYLTNAKLNKNEVLENYGHLWKIEKAFRIIKTNLKITPVYYQKQKKNRSAYLFNFCILQSL